MTSHKENNVIKLKRQALGISVVTLAVAAMQAGAVLPVDVAAGNFGSLSTEELIALPRKIQNSMKDRAVQTRYLPQWDAKTGKGRCVNAEGKEGYNRITLEEFKATKNGVCAQLQGAPLANADLENADLRLADLRGADFSGAQLLNANLSGARLGISPALFGRRANLKGAKMYGAQLPGANLFSANLKGAYLVDANLKDAGMFLADVSSADLRGADLSGAWMAGANLTGAVVGMSPTMSETDLSGAQYDDDTTLPFPKDEAILRKMVWLDED